MDPVYQQHYEYDALRQGVDLRFMRTLVLEPGTGNEPLQCRLQTSALGVTRFEAISYVWGSDVKDHEIICEGRAMFITKNLWTALRHIRTNTPRVLWADSICINQADIQEKSSQVAMMGHIYRFADRVLIFLGAEDFGHGALVHSLLEETEGIIKAGVAYAGATPGAFPWPDDDAPILTDARWRSFNVMLEQRWFNRGWVVQEIATAQNGWLLWGPYQFSWTSVIETVLWMLRRAQILFYTVVHSTGIHESLYQHNNPTYAGLFRSGYVRYSLLAILNKARALQFSDPRDRIFAFAALAQGLERNIPVQPDYNLSVVEVFQQFAANFIRETGDLELLDYVYHDEETLRSEAPSWVPRWDNRGRSLAPTRNLIWYSLRPRFSNICMPTIVGTSILKAQAVIIDEVVWTSDVLSRYTTTFEVIVNIWQAIAHASSNSPYHGTDFVGAFRNALTGCTEEGESTKWELCEAACTVHLLERSANVDQYELAFWKQRAVGGDLDRFVRVASKFSDDAKFILTRRGYMGLAPRITQERDTCAIIFGCTTPCILRSADHESRFRFLGGAILVAKKQFDEEGEGFPFARMGLEYSKDWAEWDVDEQDIELC